MAISYAAEAADHQQLEWLGGGVMHVLLDGEHTGGQFAMFRSSAPTGAASPAHVHTREDEIVVMLSGSAVFWVGEQRFEVGEGGVAFLPRGVRHAYRITSDADMLVLSTPSGLEDFFRGAGHDLKTPKPEGWQITPETMGKAAAANGQIILGPPLALDGVLPANADVDSDGVPYVAQASEHETLAWLGGGMMRILLDKDHTGGRLSLFRSSASAGSASPVYVHSMEDEIIVMLSGSGIYWVGEHRYELSAGGVVVAPRGVPMAYRITSDAETLAVATPGGLETFVRTAGRDVRQPRPDSREVSHTVLAEASEKTGQTVLGAPLEADDMIPGALLGL
ncbi:quercetin dioxygenase-like cupin family protein [Nocardia transvalensis]|uniref:Quercetin dioxygenase-like cupin family protein n=1 Tax=Nocardia transvalensis TaxID=37333 RepID=A0A7W9PK59_9NOCA|nr:cupin domain-containing protein [Nocardia transvalensis]MBB5917630.1 quercetin dioxygenase-like cupin family protein [Nocardia transvalensis]